MSVAAFAVAAPYGRTEGENPNHANFQIDVWPDLAPGETSRETGQPLPPRENEHPPVTRLINIRKPSLQVFLPKVSTGTAILILPGGGFGKVVPDKEGSEAATWLTELGVVALVLNYRTNEGTPDGEAAWRRPLQDAQRALRLIRASAERWNLKSDRVGVLGFSAGGQVAAILQTVGQQPSYLNLDEIDQYSCRPDFSLLIYPWHVLDPDTEKLLPEIKLTKHSPPAFIVHTHDDGSSSLGSVLIYAGLKKCTVDAELHIYQNGGHGYGMRTVSNSDIGTWPDRAADWLRRRGLAAR